MIETSRDWNIHKKLDETRRVYVMPARANDKTYTQLELYSELMAQNKEIKVIRAEDIRKAVELLKPKTEPDPYIELWRELDARYARLDAFIDYFYEKETSKTWEPSLYPAIWAYDEDNGFYKEQMNWLMNRHLTPVNPYLPEVYVIDNYKVVENECEME